MEAIAGHIGRQTLNTIDYILNLFAFSYSLFKLAIKRHKVGRAIVRRFILEQIYFTGYQALYVIIPIALILGSANIIMFSHASGIHDLGKIILPPISRLMLKHQSGGAGMILENRRVQVVRFFCTGCQYQ